MLCRFKYDVLWISIGKQRGVENIYLKNIDNNFILLTFFKA